MNYNELLKIIYEAEKKQIKLILEKKKLAFNENLALIAFLNGNEFSYVVAKYYDNSVVENSSDRLILEYYHGENFHKDLEKALEYFKNYR